MGILDDLAGSDAPAPPAAQAAPPPDVNPDMSGNPPPSGFLESLEAQDKATSATPEKIPSWSEIPLKAAVNAPHSAMEFGKSIARPFMHPLEAAEGIGNIALGLYQKMGLYGGHDYEKHADAVGKMLLDRYGSVDNVKKTLANDPVGAAADISALLTGGGSMAARAPGYLGKIGELTNTAGRVVDPLNAAALTAKGAGKVASEGVGILTGTGGRPLEEAARAGYEGGEASKAFTENMRGQVPLENVVSDARGAIENMRRQRGADYRAGMQAVGGDTTVLSWNKIGNAIRDANDIKTFKGQDISPKTAAVRRELNDTVLDWMALDPKEFHTAEGFDALKQKIGDIRDALPDRSPEKLVANKYYGAVRQSIVDQVGSYAKVMEGYAKASDLTQEIERTLSLGTNKGLDTSLRKLQSVLRNNVNTSYGNREKLVDYLQNSGAPHIVSALAGQSSNTLMPRGIVRLLAAAGLEGAAVHPGSVGKVAAVMPLMSPRLMGETFHGAGKIASPLKYLPPKRATARAAFQVGRTMAPQMQARGGAVDRALRATKRG